MHHKLAVDWLQVVGKDILSVVLQIDFSDTPKKSKKLFAKAVCMHTLASVHILKASAHKLHMHVCLSRNTHST